MNELVGNSELEPCPFCGGNAIEEKERVPECNNTWRFIVRCKKCLVAVAHFENPAKAHEWWNTRHA